MRLAHLEEFLAAEGAYDVIVDGLNVGFSRLHHRVRGAAGKGDEAMKARLHAMLHQLKADAGEAERMSKEQAVQIGGALTLVVLTGADACCLRHVWLNLVEPLGAAPGREEQPGGPKAGAEAGGPGKLSQRAGHVPIEVRFSVPIVCLARVMHVARVAWRGVAYCAVLACPGYTDGPACMSHCSWSTCSRRCCGRARRCW
jgi:hypothetical protein